MDRNFLREKRIEAELVALRKESVDRNSIGSASLTVSTTSLSARRAWIEILASWSAVLTELVALRKESVDRNSAGRESDTED